MRRKNCDNNARKAAATAKIDPACRVFWCKIKYLNGIKDVPIPDFWNTVLGNHIDPGIPPLDQCHESLQV